MKLDLERRRSVPEAVRIVVVHPTPVVPLRIENALEVACSPQDIDAHADLSTVARSLFPSVQARREIDRKVASETTHGRARPALFRARA
jgi:hypothetical protein